jgi:hypothetical protein
VARPVARAVVEGPAAIVRPAGLEPGPRAVGHGLRDDGEHPAESAVHAARRGLEPSVPVRVEDEREPRPLRCPAEHDGGLLPHAHAVVPEQKGPDRLAEPARRHDLLVARPRATPQEVVGAEPALERRRIGELVDAVLDVERVHEGAHELELARRFLCRAHNQL